MRWVALSLAVFGCDTTLTFPDGGDAAADAVVDAGVDVLPTFDVGPPPDPLPNCDVEVPEALLNRPGRQDDGSFIALDGRRAVSAGPSTLIEGFPADIVIHPTLRVGYIVASGSDERHLSVVDLDTFEILQRLDRNDAWFGMAIDPSGNSLYVSGGGQEVLWAFDIAADGTLTERGTFETDTYTSGVAIAPDGATLWVGDFTGQQIVEVNAATLAEERRLPLPIDAWDVVFVPGRNELYASDLAGDGIAALNLADGSAEVIPVPTSPAGLTAAPDGSTVWAAVSGSDSVVAIDTGTRSIVASALVAESDFVTSEGTPLPNSNVNDLAYDSAGDRLFVTRGADNAVSVLDADNLMVLGAFPSDQYPTGVALASDDRTLVVVSGKGGGTGSNAEGGSAKSLSKGTVAFLDLLALDLDAETTRVREQFARTRDLFTVDCEAFPVPTVEGGESPIEHVVLIVKENKTFDAILGDIDDPDVEADPELASWGLPFTPNHHALAGEFAHSDNFYVLTPNSDTGHLFLTATHLSEFAERIWLEDVRRGSFMTFPILRESNPRSGNFFTHLVDNGVGIRIYGEIVGTTLRTADDQSVADFTDTRFPGGPFVNYSTRDEDKARRIADQLLTRGLDPFTYILLPNDHTNGTRPGTPTPESMVADNDFAMGIVIDAISHSPFWPRTVIFVLEDDPQGSRDHIDAHRSVLHVVSPWARRDYVSHAHSSFLSVFATIERILGVPPVGRPEASAAPLYDMFTTTPDFTPYEVVERTYPYEVNPEEVVGAEMSERMDFRSPDRNPHLGELVRIYRRWRTGEISRERAEALLAELEADLGSDDDDADSDEGVDERDEDGSVDEASEERLVFERAYEGYRTWYRERFHRELPPLTGAPIP
ncbi:MAG: bifunctional YncE family protein/alkaline phosphatase family protein [Myxococcota bacterium]